LSKSNRFALPFFSVRDEVQSKKAIKILLYHRKCITFATH